MSFTDAVSSCFSRYATFSGRARRAEFFYFHLFTALLAVSAHVLDTLLFPGFGISPLKGLAGAIVLLPTLAVGARRLHDVGRSGRWMFLVFVPVIGLFLLRWFLRPGDPAPNRYGMPDRPASPVLPFQGRTA